MIHEEVARLKTGEARGPRGVCFAYVKTLMPLVDDETLIGYDGVHMRKGATRSSVALNFNEVSSARLLKFINKCLP
jgi:hypothetical protein